MNWIQLNRIEQLKDIFESDRRALIFKHSTRCSISSTALDRFQRAWKAASLPVDFSFYYLDLLQFRSLSQQVAELTGVQHESPQVIVLKGKEVIYAASHFDIDFVSAIS